MERFERIDKLGEGGQGKVYKVRKKESGEVVVLKMINGSDPTFATLAEREIEVMKACVHPHIVKFEESFRHDGKSGIWVCLVMEFCAAGDLFSKFKTAVQEKQRFDEKTIISWICQIIMLNQQYSNKVDIWNLGVVMLELLTFKQLPVNVEVLRNDKMQTKIMQSIMKEGYSKKLALLIASMLSRSPDDRPSAREVSQQLTYEDDGVVSVPSRDFGASEALLRKTLAAHPLFAKSAKKAAEQRQQHQQQQQQQQQAQHDHHHNHGNSGSNNNNNHNTGSGGSNGGNNHIAAGSGPGSGNNLSGNSNSNLNQTHGSHSPHQAPAAASHHGSGGYSGSGPGYNGAGGGGGASSGTVANLTESFNNLQTVHKQQQQQQQPPAGRSRTPPSNAGQPPGNRYRDDRKRMTLGEGDIQRLAHDDLGSNGVKALATQYD
eukprot:gene16409-25157_t